jgi:hypothetical protein
LCRYRAVRGFGMQRLDPQDSGPGYRNMIGLPGGMDSPLMKVIEEENVNGRAEGWHFGLDTTFRVTLFCTDQNTVQF